MELQRVEVVHNSRDQVVEYLAVAQQIADDLGINRETEAALFIKIVDLIASKTIQSVQQQFGLAGAGGMAIPRH